MSPPQIIVVDYLHEFPRDGRITVAPHRRCTVFQAVPAQRKEFAQRERNKKRLVTISDFGVPRRKRETTAMDQEA
jgi:hypothetical protein